MFNHRLFPNDDCPPTNTQKNTHTPIAHNKQRIIAEQSSKLSTILYIVNNGRQEKKAQAKGKQHLNFDYYDVFRWIEVDMLGGYTHSHTRQHRNPHKKVHCHDLTLGGTAQWVPAESGPKKLYTRKDRGPHTQQTFILSVQKIMIS